MPGHRGCASNTLHCRSTITCSPRATATTLLIALLLGLCILLPTPCSAQLLCGHDTIIASSFPRDPTTIHIQYTRSGEGGKEDDTSFPLRFNVSSVAFSAGVGRVVNPGVCGKVGDIAQDPLSQSAFTCTADDVVTSDKQQLVTEFVEEATSQLREKVFVKSNFSRGSSSATIAFADMSTSNGGACDPNTLEQLSQITPTFSYVSFGGGDAAILLLVSIAGAEQGTQHQHDDIAWINICAVDQHGRPLVAHLNFVASRIMAPLPKTSRTYREYVSSVVHQLVHAIGFTRHSLRMVEGISVRVLQRRNHSIRYMTSPSVALYAKLFFACPTLEGLELEGYALPEPTTPNTLYASHWESRTVANDVMAINGGGHETSVLSGATLAFLHDLGFYDVESWKTATGSRVVDTSTMSGASHLSGVTGFQHGCDFVTKDCRELAQAGTKSVPYCFPTSAATTQSDALLPKSCGAGDFSSFSSGFGTCGVKQHTTELPKAFQYFDGEPTLGGLDAIHDYCPTKEITPCSTSYKSSALGNTNAANSRCFNIKGQLRSAFTSVLANEIEPSRDAKRISLTDTIRCLRTRCVNGNRVEVSPFESDELSANVRNYLGLSAAATPWVSCPVNGSEGTISLSRMGFSGSVQCPPALAVCKDKTLHYDEPNPSFNIHFDRSVDTVLTVNSEMTVMKTAIAQPLGIALSNVKIQKEGSGDQFLRVSVSNATASEVLTSLQAVIDAKSNPILSSYQATYVLLMPKCDNYCSTDGTEVAMASPDGSTCTCKCKSSQVFGDLCDQCRFPFSGAFCDTCEAGLSGYPNCAVASDDGKMCPVGSARNMTGQEVATELVRVCPSLSFPLGAAIANCSAEECLCQGGIFDPTSHACNKLGFHACLTATCASQRALCEKVGIESVLDSSDSMTCAKDSLSFVQPWLSKFPEWCELNACMDSKCPEETQKAYCETYFVSAAIPLASTSLVSLFLLFSTVLLSL